MDTGWPPPELFVIVTTTSGTCSAPRSRIVASSASRSMLPLNGPGAATSADSGQGRSTASAPVCSMLARVVSKWVLLGTTSPGPHRVENRMRSAARPWCVGMTFRKPKMSRTDSSNR